MKKLMLSLCTGALMAGCAYSGVESLPKKEFGAGDFNSMLASEYKNYAEFEAYKMSDWRDAKYFADKAWMAGEGKTVMPSELAERHIPDFAVDDLMSARAKLMGALSTMKTEENLPHLAKAQASFDCWMEQQEENIQPDHIAECRVHFNDAMAKLHKPIVIVEETFRAFFDLDSAEITDEAMAVIMDAKDFIGTIKGSSIVLTGSTDTSGSAEYNKELSEKRAQAVYDAMMGAGIPEHKVKIMGEGESNLLVKTEDGVREPKNRRVDIFIVRTSR